MDDATKTAISDNIKGPRKVEGDEATVEQHNPRDAVDAAQSLAASDAAAQPARGIRFTRMRTPGVSDFC